jgi:nucleoside-diphosphate-sugar epimerase
MKKVLITGMSGLIGGLLRSRLEQAGGYELTALNRRPVEGVRTVQADISDLDAIKPAFEGQDAVVHLAAELSENWAALLATSVVGTYNVYEAARLSGVNRVVFASSGATIRGWGSVAPYEAIQAGRYKDVPDQWPMITHETMVRPRGLYGASKVWGEALGRHFSDTYGMSVLCVRIGAVPADNRAGDPTAAANFLSHADVAGIMQACIEARPMLQYDVFFATSRNRWGYRDLEHPRRVLGWESQDSAEDRSG